MCNKWILILMLSLSLSLDAQACKFRKELSDFPIDEARHDNLALIEVTSATSKGPSVYEAPPLDFKAKVVESFIGDLKEDELIEGQTGNEGEAHAVCGVGLTVGKKYIVILVGKNEFNISRFSYRSSEDDPSYEHYLRHLRKWKEAEGT